MYDIRAARRQTFHDMFHSRACRLSRAAAVCRGSVRLPFENVRGPSSDAVLGRGAVCTRPACLNLFRIETESHEKEYRAKDAPASTGTVTVHRRCANGSVPSRVATPLSPHTRPHTRFAGRSHLRRWAAPYPVRPTAPPSRKVGGTIPEREFLQVAFNGIHTWALGSSDLSVRNVKTRLGVRLNSAIALRFNTHDWQAAIRLFVEHDWQKAATDEERPAPADWLRAIQHLPSTWSGGGHRGGECVQTSP